MPITTTFASASARGYGYAGYVVSATITSFTVNGANVSTANSAIGYSTLFTYSTTGANLDVKLTVPRDSTANSDITLNAASGSIYIVPQVNINEIRDVCSYQGYYYICGLSGVVARSANGTNWQRVNLPNVGLSNPINQLIPGADGSIIAIGSNTRVYSSTDGTASNWTSASSGITASNFTHFMAGVQGVTSAGTNTYVIGANDGKCYYNALGGAGNWTLFRVVVAAATQPEITTMAYGNVPGIGHRYIVGVFNSYSTIYWTSDPANGASAWNRVTGVGPFPTSSISLQKIAYGNGVFVGIDPKDTAGTGYRSFDGGLNWASVGSIHGAAPTEQLIIKNIKYVNGYFIALGNNGYYYLSTTGASGSWTAFSVSSHHENLSVAYNSTANNYCMVGNGSSIISIGNIINAGSAVKRNYAFGSPVNAVAWNKGLTYTGSAVNEYVAVSNFGAAAYSTDGIIWVSILTKAKAGPYYGNYYSINDIIYNGNRFVLVGEAGNVQWAQSPSGGFNYATSNTPDNLFSIGWSGTKFIAGGNGAGTTSTTGDSNTWNAVALPLGGIKNGTYTVLKGITHTYMGDVGLSGSSGRWVAVGSTASLALTAPIHYSNDDGATWSAFTTQSGDTDFRSVCYGNFFTGSGTGRFVAVGYNSASNVAIIYYSLGMNPSQWSKATTTLTGGSGTQLNCVRFVNGKFFALGNAGLMLVSTDGINWTVISQYSVHSTFTYNGACATSANNIILCGNDSGGGGGKVLMHNTTSYACTRYNFDPFRSLGTTIVGNGTEYSVTLKIPGVEQSKTITM